MWKLKTALLFVLVLLPFSPKVWGDDAASAEDFVVRKGDKLYLGKEEYRFISFNLPNLTLIEDNLIFLNGSPWRWPNEYEISDALESVRQLGGTVVRTYVLSVYRPGSDLGDHVFVRGPGEFNEEAFQVLDQLLAQAREQGVRVIIPLVDYWHWWGGRAEYARFRNKRPKAFWTDEQVQSDFEDVIRYTLNRVNTVNGIAYKDDPTILAWETGNEITCPPEWTSRMAALMKSIDGNHLVIDGNSLNGVPTASLHDPNVDVITTHHYPKGFQDISKIITEAKNKTRGHKPYFVGEFGFCSTEEIEEVLDAVIQHDISGALLWSLRFHNRDGGFYWHWEPAGGGLYKAYHWPGFDSGKDYDERQVLDLMRNKAFAIRGLPVPPIEGPSAPTLLPIADVGAISWQGSAGASAYDVERADDPNGPWKVVGHDVDDTEVQYHPLFNDADVAVGQSYFYRVTAKNAAGASPPSDIVGPVKARWKMAVDECRGLEKLHNHQGNVTFVSKDARKVREDCHRLRLEPGSSVTYRVDGPIRHFRVYLFAKNEDADFWIECSEDGREFTLSTIGRESPPVGKDDYGYLVPICLTGAPESPDMRFVRIHYGHGEGDDDSSSPAQLSRVEIRYGAQPEDQSASDPAQPACGAILSPSILLSHKPYRPVDLAAIGRADLLGSPTVNVVPTLFCRIDETDQVLELGMVREGQFQPLDEELLKSFRETLQQAFEEAAAHELEIAILPHLNSWGEVHQWRNNFRFDPLVKYGQYNYMEAVIEPIVDALIAAEIPLERVDLALAGEMGNSVFTHADSYRKIMQHLRATHSPAPPSLGISLNFTRVSGGMQPSSEQQAALQQLIDDCDFLGFSNYRWFQPPPSVQVFETAVRSFSEELLLRGVTLPEQMPLHFSEVGIGGGALTGGLAETPEEAGNSPWNGSDNPSRNPWSTPEMRKLRFDFHRALLDFLLHQPTEHRITKAFLWSEGSWDPTGIDSPEFADEKIIALIRQHNEAVGNGAGND